MNMGFQGHVHYSSNCSKTIVYILTLVMLNIFKCISEFYHVIRQYSSCKYIIWKTESFRNRENLQHKKKADSVLLKIVSEYVQEIPQTQTADNPMAPRGRAAQPSRDTRKTN